MGDFFKLLFSKVPSHKDRRQLTLLTLGLFCLFALLLVQFYRVQVVQGDKWLKKAHSQHKWVSKEPFRRGIFYSGISCSPSHINDRVPLVIDVPKYHLHVDSKAIPALLREELSDKIIESLHAYALTKKHVLEQLNKHSRSRRIHMWIDKEDKQAIEAWWKPFASKNKIPSNALFFISDYKRSYPLGDSMGHLLHTIRDYKEEKTFQGIPTGGLEEAYNEFLKGKMGKRLYLRSPRHSLEIGEIIEPPQNGADVYLTLDPVLQAIADEEIEYGVKQFKAVSGWAILMNPHNGQILAWAQYPTFDPRDYSSYFNDPEKINYAKTLGAVDAQQPGSVMKALSLAVFLKANKENELEGLQPFFDPQEKMYTEKGDFKGRSKPFYDTGKHKYLNMNMALQVSSNIYFAKMIDRILEVKGNAWYRNILAETFGFGEQVGLEIPGESSGLLPRIGKRHPNGKLEWSVPTPYSLVIGHNILVSSVQLLRAYAVLANGGYLIQPHLVEKIERETVAGEKELLWERDTHTPAPKVLDDDIVARVTEAMRFTTKIGGTAHRGDIPGYTEVGKTGTSEKIVNGRYSKDLYFATFIGFAPATQPRFVLLVSLNEPEKKYIPGVGKNHNAGVCCAPVFREIGRRALEYMEVVPDDPYGYPYGDPRRDYKLADWNEENQALKNLYQEWNGS